MFHDVIRSWPHCCCTTSPTAAGTAAGRAPERVAVEVDEAVRQHEPLPGTGDRVVGVELLGAGAGVGEVHPRTLGLVPAWAAWGTSAARRRPQGRACPASTYAVAAASTVVLLALAGRYGPHRDELYFIAAGHHPQWGYPDQPPLTPLVAAAADTLVPGSLLALRALSAVIVGVVVLLTADLARALGGDRGAQLLAAVATATGAGLLAIGHLLSTATLDLLAWTVVIRLVVATLQHDRPRLWLAVGLALGVGLENKHLVGVPRRRSRRRDRDHAGRCGTTCGPRGPGAVRPSRSRCGCPTWSGRPTTAGRSSSSPATSATSTARSAAPSSSSPSRS